MRWIDLLKLPLAALWQQKMRTALTMLGVIFGAFVLAASLSIDEGIQKTIDRESRREDISRRIDISPGWGAAPTPDDAGAVKVEGTMSEPRRARIRKELAAREARSRTSQVRVNLTRDRLEGIAKLPHVAGVVPMVYNAGFAMLGPKSEMTQVTSCRPNDEVASRRLVAGRYLKSVGERGVLVSEFLAYRLGYVDESEMNALIGKPLRLEFRWPKPQAGFFLSLMKPMNDVTREERGALDKVTARLPTSLDKFDLTDAESAALRKAMKAETAGEPDIQVEEFPVVGILRELTGDERKADWDPYRIDSDVMLPYRTALDVYFGGKDRDAEGVGRAIVQADEEANVKELVKQIAAMGLEARGAIEFIERERLMYLLIFGCMTCVAAVALLVSALGIANTMLMSVLERTREIGIMKAVGADNRHLQFLFLVEGALIGTLGALIGLLLAWAASFPGDAWVRSMVMRDLKIDLKSSIFAFPPWIALTVITFTVLVTTIAAAYPARHATRIDPVTALRHE